MNKVRPGTIFDSELPAQGGNAGKVLGTNGTVASWVAQSGGSGASKKIVVIGDSTAYQSPSTAPSWPQILETTINQSGGSVRVVDLGWGGQSTYEAVNVATHTAKTAMQVAIEEQPDVVIIALGAVETMIQLPRTLAQCKIDFDTLVTGLRAALPTAKIVYASQLLYDSTNFTTGTLKNKGVIPYFYTLKAAGILANAYCSEMLDDAVSAPTKALYADWASWNTYVSGNIQVDDTITLNYWRMARMGAMSSDGLHPHWAGRQILAMYVLKGLVNTAWFSTLFPSYIDYTGDAGEDPDQLFAEMFSVSGDGYTWNQAIVNESIAQDLGDSRRFNPESWYLPSKCKSTPPITMYNSDDSIFQFHFHHGPPGQTVYLSGGGAAFTITDFVFDAWGFCSIIAPADGVGLLDGANTWRFKAGDEVYGPFTITTLAPATPYVYAARTSASSQAISLGVYTTVIFESEINDLASEYNPATGIITCSRKGKYQVCATLRIDSAPNQSVASVEIQKNGAMAAQGTFPSNGTGVTDSLFPMVSHIIDVAAGDTLKIVALTSFNGSIVRGNSPYRQTVLTARYLGR